MKQDTNDAENPKGRKPACPATITSIKVGQEGERLSIHVGRRVVAKLAPEHLGELGLSVGMEWTDKLAARVAQVQRVFGVEKDALRLIGKRALSRRALRDKLTALGHEPDLVDRTLEDLQTRGLIDDHAVGQAFLRQLQSGKPMGGRLVAAKMANRKIDRAVAQKLAREHEETTDMVEQARQLLKERLSRASIRELDPPARSRRLWGLLARRGFDGQTISKAMKGLNELASEDGEE